ncbi:MAG: tetratricopeptide repeat protein [Terriglobia bacterium]
MRATRISRFALPLLLMTFCAAPIYAGAPLQASPQDLAYQQALQNLNQGASALDLTLLTRARETFQKLAAEHSSDAHDVYQLARVDYYMGSYYEMIAKNKKTFEQAIDDALRNAERAVQLEPDDSNAHALLGDLYGRKIGLGGIFAGMKYGPKGTEQMNQAVKLDPRNPYAYACLGRRYLFAPRAFGGNIQKAIESFKKATELDPTYDEGFVWLGIAYKTKGGASSARQDFNQALKIDPQNAQARIELKGLGGRK